MWCWKQILNRSITLFPKTDVVLKPKEQKFIQIETPFIDELPGIVMVRLLDLKAGGTYTFKVRFIMDVGFLSMTNNSSNSKFQQEHIIGYIGF